MSVSAPHALPSLPPASSPPLHPIPTLGILEQQAALRDHKGDEEETAAAAEGEATDGVSSSFFGLFLGQDGETDDEGDDPTIKQEHHQQGSSASPGLPMATLSLPSSPCCSPFLLESPGSFSPSTCSTAPSSPWNGDSEGEGTEEGREGGKEEEEVAVKETAAAKTDGQYECASAGKHKKRPALFPLAIPRPPPLRRQRGKED